MKSIYDRTRMLLGTNGMIRIQKSNIIVFGLGGVGGHATEALVRAGAGRITIVDFDVIDITNINRQIIALHSNVGRLKTDVMEERIKDINPEIKIQKKSEKLTSENIDNMHLEVFDYIVDAIDDVQAKLLLIEKSMQLNVPIICSMGTGNKFDPSQLKVSDIKKTHTCPLAKIIRKETAKLGIKKLKVVFSTETPHREEYPDDGNKSPSSISFVPGAAGLLIASEVVKDLLISNTSEKYLFGIKLNPPKAKIEY